MGNLDSVWYLGVDVGGTRLKALAFTAAGDELGRAIVPSSARAFRQLRDEMVEIGHGFAADLGVGPAGIGVATPGITRADLGPVLLPGRLAGSEGYPIVAELRAEFGCEAICLNDGLAAALGEHRFGAGAGSDRMAMLTLGTGIGGGIVIDGRPLADLATGEGTYLGHQVLQPGGAPCVCGNRGCAETLLSPNALVGNLLAALRRQVPSSLAERFAGDPGSLTFIDLVEAARSGDGLSAAIFADFRALLGAYLVSIAHGFAAQTIVLGGGMMHASDLFLAEVAEWVERHQFRPEGIPAARVVAARSHDFAGSLGAVVPLLGV